MTITFYKLHHATDNTKECYIGSTGDFKARKIDHKRDCNNPNRRGYTYKVYTYIREHGGCDAYTHTILEVRTDQMTKLDRLMRERELTIQYKATLNTNKAGSLLEAGSCLEYQRTPQQKEAAKRRNHEMAGANYQ